jgi:hypothetical protein
MAQRYFILGDDTARGERFRETLTVTASGTASERERYIADQRMAAAVAFYDHEIAEIDIPGQGSAPPTEKAFFHACSGWVLGG